MKKEEEMGKYKFYSLFALEKNRQKEIVLSAICNTLGVFLLICLAFMAFKGGIK